MTVSSQVRKAGPYSGTGSTGPFTFSFKVFAASDVLVVKADSNGVETTLVLTTDYTVSLNADQNSNPGGTVTLEAALASGYTMVISSQVPYLQETDLTNQGGFYPEVITDSLDKLTIQVQQIKLESDRAAKVPITSSADADALVDDLIAVANNEANINTVAANVDDINTVAADIDNVNIVAANVVDVTNFAEVYYGPSATDPTTRRDGSTLEEGDLYFNTSSNAMFAYTSSGWVATGTAIPVTITTQQFSGNGSTTVFTLSTAATFSTAADVYISGVAQRVTTDYTVSGTTLTFTTAPPSGTNNIYVRIVSSYAGGTPNDGSVSTVKIVDGAVTASKVSSTTGSGAFVLATAPTITGVKETKAAVSASNIDLATANYFSKTISGDITFTVSNTASSGSVSSFILDLTNGGSSTITWWSGIKWAGGFASELTASGRDILGFFTHDGGSTWNGLVLAKDIK